MSRAVPSSASHAYSIEHLERRLLLVTVPAGFQVTEVSSSASIDDVVTLELGPDSKMYIVRQNGFVQVYANYSTFHPTPLQTNFFQNAPLPSLDFQDERGLIGFTLDPNFSTNKFVYVHYTTTAGGSSHNRISRFTANSTGQLALAGTEQVLLELDSLGALNHNGGGMHFGPDGKLYIGVGDNNATPAPSQFLNSFKGKLLRINPTPGNVIPSDNPTSFSGVAGSPTGNYRAIWAIGLRNPFTFAFQPGTGRLFINDVGGNTDTSWEEINDGVAGRNYGWPLTEGDFNQGSFPNLTRPFFTYNHTIGSPTGFALVGGAFYNPATFSFPAAYAGQYFFQDYPVGWIKRINPTTAALTDFATGADAPLDLDVAPDGSLLYLRRAGLGSAGRAVRVTYTGSLAPYIISPPANTTVTEGNPATFTVVAGGGQPLSYQWQRKNVGGSFSNIAGATSATYVTPATVPDDDGAQFRVIVDNAEPGNITSTAATLTVTFNHAPVASIDTPTAGTLYTAGTTLNFSGSATDLEQGTLPASAFSWRIDFHHHAEGSPGAHIHPGMPTTTGITSGSYNIPATGHPEADVWYRIHLTVTDAGGLQHEVTRDVLPRTVNLTFAASTAGLSINLDTLPTVLPQTQLAVVGTIRNLDAPATQIFNTETYYFVSWSDAGARVHDITTPLVNTTYTVSYNRAPVATISTPPAGTLFSGGQTINFSGMGTDPEQGTLAASALTWQVDLHQGAVVTTIFPPTSGITGSSFVVPTTGLATNAFYKIQLTVTDAQGLQHSTFRDVLARTANITLAASTPGLTLNFDSQPQTTPFTELGVVGLVHSLEAPATQFFSGQWYQFVSWSDAGARAHDITAPATDTTYTATYAIDPAPSVTASNFAFDGVTLPSLPHRLSFTFSENVFASLSVSDLVLFNATTSQTISPANFALAWNGGTNTATFTFPGFTNGVLPDGNYTATLPAASVTDSLGQPLPADHVLNFKFLMGDANHDGIVNVNDFTILAGNFGMTGRIFSQGDFNYDGTVNINDFTILAGKFGAALAGKGRFGQVQITGPGRGRGVISELEGLLG